MPSYEIWLQGKNKAQVDGDTIEKIPSHGPGGTKKPEHQGFGSGDVVVRKGGAVVAWYKASEVVGYNEVEPPGFGIA